MGRLSKKTVTINVRTAITSDNHSDERVPWLIEIYWHVCYTVSKKTGATGRRLACIMIGMEITAQFSRQGRLFLFIGIAAKHISYAEYRRCIAENGHQFQHRHGISSLLVTDSPKGFYGIGGSQSLRRGPTAYRQW